jgi:hypothetical protein
VRRIPAVLVLAVGAVGLGVALAMLSPGRAAEPMETPAKNVGRLLAQLDEEVQKLIRQLGSRSFKARKAAIKQLTDIGRPALPMLRKAVKSSDLEVRQRARQVIAAIRTSLSYLVENLEHEDPLVRKGAAEALEQLGPAAKSAVPALVRALKDEDESVRDAATGALLTLDPRNKAVADKGIAKARVGGKYAKLLKRIKVPQDKATYQEFSDFGYFEGTSHAGYNDLPPGYWVYVFPYWYIWGELKKGQ